jgi:hypothetical protein
LNIEDKLGSATLPGKMSNCDKFYCTLLKQNSTHVDLWRGGRRSKEEQMLAWFPG